MTAQTAKEYAQQLADDLPNWRDELPDEDDLSWFEGVLDVERIHNAAEELTGLRFLVSFGGPNAWITMYRGVDSMKVESTWYSDMQIVYTKHDDRLAELSDMAFDIFYTE